MTFYGFWTVPSCSDPAFGSGWVSSSEGALNSQHGPQLQGESCGPWRVSSTRGRTPGPRQALLTGLWEDEGARRGLCMTCKARVWLPQGPWLCGLGGGR